MRSILATVLTIACAGCSLAQRTQQEKIAKDWCLNIRASQVIPVYPLTTDLRPGDLFVVPYTVENEFKLYQATGFMPLTGHVGRVPPAGYASFYDGFYGLKADQPCPLTWPYGRDGAVPKDGLTAPRVVFPSYSFKVNRKVATELAVPVEGVPLAMDYLRAEEANARIQISGGYSYGVDEFSLREQVSEWARKNQATLASFDPEGASRMRRRYWKNHLTSSLLGQNPFANQFHLRIVTRVFLADSVTVSVHATERTEATIAANRTGAQPATQPADGLGRWLAQVPAHVGANVKAISESDRSVTLESALPGPMVVGYLAFDVPVGDAGELQWARASIGAPGAQHRKPPLLP